MKPSYLFSILNNSNISLKKNKGQNFLIDKNILNKIVASANIKSDDIVLEIGAGVGNLTHIIAEKARYVYANEIDKKLLPILHNNLSSFNNIKIISDDFLEINLNELFKNFYPHCKIKIVANIPYNISTLIISKIFENKKFFNVAILTLQKEFAERLVAEPSTQNYGRLSLFTKFHSSPEILFNIKKTCFFPQPKVTSSVVRLNLKDNIWNIKDNDLFFKIISVSFQHRRKTIKNALLDFFENKNNIEEILLKCNINPKSRPQTLSIDDYISISNMCKH